MHGNNNKESRSLIAVVLIVCNVAKFRLPSLYLIMEMIWACCEGGRGWVEKILADIQSVLFSVYPKEAFDLNLG